MSKKIHRSAFLLSLLSAAVLVSCQTEAGSGSSLTDTNSATTPPYNLRGGINTAYSQ